MQTVTRTKVASETTKAPASKAPATPKTSASTKKYSKLAVIRVRGNVGRDGEIERTMTLSNLTNQNTCVLIEGTPVIVGMLRKIQAYVTWGNITPEVETMLHETRKPLKENVYRLSPPKKGFGRRGVKMPFTVSGALGNRRDKINDLIKRMV